LAWDSVKILLDTHAFLWWDSQPDRLSSQALALCQSQENTLWLSVASAWETQIKLKIGKLKLALPLAEIIEDHRAKNGCKFCQWGWNTFWR
jgi:PIN domain nuclease of toxin-antitoxin system